MMLLNCGVGEDSRVPWTARRSNQSILKVINPEQSLEAQMLKLKFQYFDHLMGRADSLEKTQILRNIEGKEGNRQHHQLNRHESEQTLVDGGQESLQCGSLWGLKESDTTQRLNNNMHFCPHFPTPSIQFMSFHLYTRQVFI